MTRRYPSGLINCNREKYFSAWATVQNKREVVQAIVDDVYLTGGFFLKETSSQGKKTWTKLLDDSANQKVAHALQYRQRCWAMHPRKEKCKEKTSDRKNSDSENSSHVKRLSRKNAVKNKNTSDTGMKSVRHKETSDTRQIIPPEKQNLRQEAAWETTFNQSYLEMLEQYERELHSPFDSIPKSSKNGQPLVSGKKLPQSGQDETENGEVGEETLDSLSSISALSLIDDQGEDSKIRNMIIHLPFFVPSDSFMGKTTPNWVQPNTYEHSSEMVSCTSGAVLERYESSSSDQFWSESGVFQL